MFAGIKDPLIISTPIDTPRFGSLLGDVSQFGVNLSYKVQPSPDGLAQTFILGEEFFAGEAGAMVLGDNIFYGNDSEKSLELLQRTQKTIIELQCLAITFRIQSVLEWLLLMRTGKLYPLRKSRRTRNQIMQLLDYTSILPCG